MEVRRAFVLAVGLALTAAAPAYGQTPPPTIADGVTVAGYPVGGLTREEATEALRARFHQPMLYKLRKRTFRAAPSDLAAWARVYRSVRAALVASEGARIGLEVAVRTSKLRRWVRARARWFNRAPRNSRVYLKRSLRPRVTNARAGRRLRPSLAKRALRRELLRHERGPVSLPTRRVRPRVTRRSFGPVVVIRRGTRSLRLYRGMNRRGMFTVRAFRVAVGQPSFPTPLGRFRIVSKQRNPWWYPPNTGWASGSAPIPPGPGNPLGTRWMGLSVGAVGIHGTYNSASVGGFASHGCVRMYLHEAEWLFERVRLGTTVFVVSA